MSCTIVLVHGAFAESSSWDGVIDLDISERFPNQFVDALRPRPFPQRFTAKRANAHTTAINSSHASYISHPAEVTKLILRAVRKAG